ncbi:MAG: succinylglutamate desuccinylase/aspartoacylase family protein [Neoaquamicrobium sediminum]|uniref:succinylglutamate desuccinylase/aspartoacylase family protein n=1 Tax=Neoaquamicrobium sediminum TaxID=1849104 RepID=UPI004036BB4F
MSSRKTMIAADVDFDRQGLQFGRLRLPHSVHRSAYGHIPIPIAIAANGSGPTVLLTGGVHGDEYEGPIALSRLAREIDIDRVRGRIIIVPMLNHPAFAAGTRVSPIDDINLNRIFPGRRDGTATEMIAHYVTTELLPRADCLIDLHAGGSSLQYLPALLAPRWSDPQKAARVDALVTAFGAENVIYFDSVRALSGEDRVIGNYADQNDVDFLTGEFGGGSSVNIDGLATAERGVRGVLAHLGVFPAEGAHSPRKGRIRRLAMDDSGLYAFADRRGFFEPKFALGHSVAAGALAGLIHDIDNPWQTPVEIFFRTGGIAMCVRTFSLVEAGDCLGHLAREI